MDATGPTTRPAYSLFELRAHPLDMLFSGFRFLDGDGPTDPLVTRERSDIFPFCPRRRISGERLSQIRRQLMYRTVRNPFLSHKAI